MSSKFDILAEGLAFPEGPVVMADGSVIVVELAGARITRCWNGRKESVCEIGGGPNGAAIGPDGALYVCNNGGLDTGRMQSAHGPGHEGRIERVDLATGRFERLYDHSGDNALSGPNDLVFDRDGRMWFTDLGKHYDRIHEAGGLYTCLPDGSSIAMINDQSVGYNGIGLSPDQEHIYVADTFQARVYRYARKVGEQRPEFVATVPGHVGLDSLAMTQAGNVCVGTLYQGAISTVTPEGEVSSIPYDDTFVTNIAFGGPDMRSAYITLSASGRLVRADWNEPGLPLSFSA